MTLIHNSQIRGIDPTLLTTSLDGLVGGQEEAALCGIGDLRVDDGARDHVAIPVPVAGLGREHPRLVPLLGDDERDSCIWSLHFYFLGS